jgi:glycosyltransferase involved in cell wall biosynthesis
MKILMIAENDPAGTAISFTKAINRYTGHTCRLITKEIRYNFIFEKDIHLPWLEENQTDKIESLLKNSDIFHFHMTIDENISLGPFKPKDYMSNKGIVHHHHGHPDFRKNSAKYREKYKRFNKKNLLVSTPDLLHLLPGAKWQPNLVPINDPLYMPNENNTNGKIRIGQSVTRKDIKNTKELIHTTEAIKKKSSIPGIELDIIEMTDHAECLKRKQKCHIFFDHMQGYFGVSSLESLSQGTPVIAGLDKWNIKHIKEFTGAAEMPWVIAKNADELEKCLAALIHDPDLRLRAAANSRSFMENCWTEQQVLKLLLSFYDSL